MLRNTKKSGWYLLTAVSAAFLIGQSAHALVNLKKVQVTDGSQIDLLFDGKVSQGQIQTEFFNDIIQVSLTDASVYPAKISSLSGAEITKVFAYQYSPRLVRCRFTVKGKAESYQGRIKVTPSGKLLSVRILAAGSPELSKVSARGFAGKKDKVEKKDKDEAAPVKQQISGGKEQAPKLSDEEKVLLDRVMNSQAAPAPVKVEPTPDKSEKSEHKSTGLTRDGAKRPLTGARPLPSPMRSIGMLLAICALFGFLAIVLKKARTKGVQNHKGLGGFIGKFAANLGIATKGKMIDVVATHYLGPKKSIAVVRIAGRLLVVGVTNDSINLIAQLPANAMDGGDEGVAALTGGLMGNIVGTGARAAAKAPMLDLEFDSDVDNETETGPALNARPAFQEVLNTERARPSVRSQIRSKLEGMKQL